MLTMGHRAVLFAVIFQTYFGSPIFAADSFVGTWKLNIGESKPGPGFANKSAVLTIVETGADTTHWYFDQVRKDGTKSPVEVDIHCDGKQHPADIHGVHIITICKTSDASTRTITYTQDGSVTLNTVWTLSAQGTVLKGDGDHTPRNGTRYQTIFVYEKQ